MRAPLVFLVALMLQYSNKVAGCEGKPEGRGDISSFSKLASKLEAEMDSKYFQEFSEFMNSKEFETVLGKEEKSAKADGKNERFYIAGFIRGVSDYCQTEVLLRGDGHAKLPLNSRWKVKNDEYAGYLEGSRFGREHGNKLYDRLVQDLRVELKEHAELGK